MRIPSSVDGPFCWLFNCWIDLKKKFVWNRGCGFQLAVNIQTSVSMTLTNPNLLGSMNRKLKTTVGFENIYRYVIREMSFLSCSYWKMERFWSYREIIEAKQFSRYLLKKLHGRWHRYWDRRRCMRFVEWCERVALFSLRLVMGPKQPNPVPFRLLLSTWILAFLLQVWNYCFEMINQKMSSQLQLAVKRLFRVSDLLVH